MEQKNTRHNEDRLLALPAIAAQRHILPALTGGLAFSMIHREFGKLSAIQQKNVQNMQSLPSWQSLKSSCFRQNLSVCQMIQVIITLESAKVGKLRCCQRQLLILITVIGNYVLFLHA